MREAKDIDFDQLQKEFSALIIQYRKKTEAREFNSYDARVAARKHHDAVFVPARPSEGEVQAGSLQTQLLSYYLS